MMADPPSEGRKARTRIVKAPSASNAPLPSDGPTILDAEAFTHGGVPKAKFVPKVPQRRVKKLAAVKKEPGENSEAELSDFLRLMKQSKEEPGRRGPGMDKKVAPVRVAFGYGSSGSFGRPVPGFSRGGGGGGGGGSGGGAGSSRGVDKKPSIDDDAYEGMLIDDKTGKRSKQYDEPMDYSTYYPISLPLRKPYSGKSEMLDEEEFGEGSTNTFDEDTIVPAEELDLWNQSTDDKIFFFQLPGSLPLGRLPVVKAETTTETSTGANSKDVSRSDDKSASSSGASSTSNKESFILERLPAGFMGKLLVYESGAVKMKLGDILLDAVPGSECVFAQDVAAINSVTKQCCFLGDIDKRITLVPDVDSLLENTVDIG